MPGQPHEHFEMRTHKRLIDIIDPDPPKAVSRASTCLTDVNIEVKL